MVSIATQPPVLATRALALLVGCMLLCAATWSLVRAPLLAAMAAGSAGSLTLQTAVLGGSAAVLLACVGWGVVSTVLAVAGLLAHELAPRDRGAAGLLRLVERRCPGVARRLAATALGLTLGAGAALPATAGPLSGPLSGLQVPDRATGAGFVSTTRASIGPSAGHPSRQQAGIVVVRHGDSLWQIAERLLPPGATDAEITEAWHRIDHTNAERIGADPDLIRPGIRLTVPPLPLTHRKDPA